jgi:hypothetical protein
MWTRVVWLCLLASLLGCSPRESQSQDSAAAGQTPDPLADEAYVFLVMRYLYRWHSDEALFLNAGDATTPAAYEVWTRRLHPQLDAGDHSEFAEMWIPAVGIFLELKRAEYGVPELKLDIAEGSFKIQRVERTQSAPAAKNQYHVRRYDRQKTMDLIFATKDHIQYPSEVLDTRIRDLVNRFLRKHQPPSIGRLQTFFVSGISPVCNELWIFWQNEGKILHFSSAMDLHNPKFWEITPLNLKVIDLRRQVVVSGHEVPGSNAFLTKDWAGRMLYNCIVLGERLDLTPDTTGP